MKLIVARHGQSVLNSKGKNIYQGVIDSELTEDGRKQAEMLASRLKNHKIEVIYTSPLKRAMETARIIQKTHPEADFIVEKDLMEINYGIFEGLSRDEIMEKHSDVWEERSRDKFNYRIPEGESFPEAEERIIRVLTRILKDKRDSLVIAHGTINKLIFKNLMKKGMEDMDKIRQNNTSVSIFKIKGDEVSVEEFNCDKHLKG